MEDSKLLKKIQQGDLKAFQVLVTKYQKRAIGLAWTIVRDYQIAEDLSQEAFLRVLKNIHNYKECGKFENYFFFILKNLCLNELKKKRFVNYTQEEISQAIEEKSPSFSLEKEEHTSVLHQAILQLKEKERLAIFLKTYENLKYSEIAELLGMGLSNVKVTIHRAFKKLKNILEEELWTAKK